MPPSDAAPSGIDPVVACAVASVGAGEVTAATELTSGASRRSWRCSTTIGGDVVVQQQHVWGRADVGVEARVIAAAAAAGVPVPELVGFVPEVDGSAVLITRAVEGEAIPRRILRDDGLAGARARLVEQLGRAVARVHRVDASGVPGLERIDLVDHYRAELDEIGEPHPALELAFRWLRDHRPAARSPTLVHGDLRLGNVIVDRSGLAAVIDWELVHVGDPLEDLGWLCVPAWRFGSPRPAAGLGTRRELLDAYNDEAGADVDLDTLAWWEVAGILKWAIICVMQAHRHRSGEVRSHELAAIGRRICENEHDLFLALEGRW